MDCPGLKITRPRDTKSKRAPLRSPLGSAGSNYLSKTSVEFVWIRIHGPARGRNAVYSEVPGCSSRLSRFRPFLNATARTAPCPAPPASKRQGNSPCSVQPGLCLAATGVAYPRSSKITRPGCETPLPSVALAQGPSNTAREVLQAILYSGLIWTSSSAFLRDGGVRYVVIR